jgi:hypothetical protein
MPRDKIQLTEKELLVNKVFWCTAVEETGYES